MIDDSIISARGIRKRFGEGENVLEILRGIDLDVRAGEAVCIVGTSGAGKSTLMHILGTLDRPSEGKVYFEGSCLNDKSDDELAAFRNRAMGFVFQFHHLLAEFTAEENVMLPMRIGGVSRSEAESRSQSMLRQLGVLHRASHYPSELSGGEKQRVAIARALIQQPKILFADEPTGNLDGQNGRMIQKLFFELKDELGLTLIVVTHDKDFASRFPRVITMEDGQWIG